MFILLFFSLILCEEQDNYDPSYKEDQLRNPYHDPFPFVVEKTIIINETTHGNIPVYQGIKDKHQPYVALEIPKGCYILFSLTYSKIIYEIHSDGGYLYREINNGEYGLTTFGNYYAGKVYIKNTDTAPISYYILGPDLLKSETLANCQMMANIPTYQYSFPTNKYCIFDPNLQNFTYKAEGPLEFNITYYDHNLKKLISEHAILGKFERIEEKMLGPTQFTFYMEIDCTSYYSVSIEGKAFRNVILFPTYIPSEYESFAKTSEGITYVDPFKQAGFQSMKILENDMTYSPDLDISTLIPNQYEIHFYVRDSVEFKIFDLNNIQYYYFDIGTNRLTGGIANDINSVKMNFLYFISGNFDNFLIDYELSCPPYLNSDLFSLYFEDQTIRSIPKFHITMDFKTISGMNNIKANSSLKIYAKTIELQTKILEAIEPIPNISNYKVSNGKVYFNSYYSFEDGELFIIYEMGQISPSFVGTIVGIVVGVVVAIVVVVVIVVCIIKKKKAKQSSEASEK